MGMNDLPGWSDLIPVSKNPSILNFVHAARVSGRAAQYTASVSLHTEVNHCVDVSAAGLYTKMHQRYFVFSLVVELC